MTSRYLFSHQTKNLENSGRHNNALAASMLREQMENDMSFLAKLNLKTVQRINHTDPVIARREKLLAGIAEQHFALDAMLCGGHYVTEVTRWRKNEAGERVQVDIKKRVRPWFFQQDNGWYVQCRYGARVLTINGKSNAVFVAKLDEVAKVLEAFKAATESGELDGAVVAAMSKASKA
ncbi:hypothetical protein [Novosphingobium sp. AAP83]|uniref:hypothetical protein n=1 Tax=Novosphingobium sp. AAP83 TaxID=1523425 RepID=UPI0018D09555|nr:hypothetical protein [Novosphingobium sp. AAP83]